MGQMPSTSWLLPLPLLFLFKLVRLLNPPPPDISTVSQLPPELLLRIAYFLPPTSAGAFALCTKRLHTVLAIPHLKCKRGHAPFDTAEFLRLLEPSLPNHIVCYYCDKLHLIEVSKKHIQYEKRCDIKVNELMRSYIHPRFSYVIFQMAMKRHRQGLDNSALLQQLSYKESGFNKPKIKTSFRIVDGTLLLRQQYIFVIHPNNWIMHHDLKIMICPHIKDIHVQTDYNAIGARRYSMGFGPSNVDVDRTPTKVECDSCEYQGKKEEDSWSGLVRCRGCATEFRIDWFGVGKEGKAFVVTRWKDLGEGRDGRDEVWRAQMGEGGAGRRADGRSVCVRFEGKGWRGGLESLLTEKEMRALVKYRYMLLQV